jgi:hypothetical protein
VHVEGPLSLMSPRHGRRSTHIRASIRADAF